MEFSACAVRFKKTVMTAVLSQLKQHIVRHRKPKVSASVDVSLNELTVSYHRELHNPPQQA
jgi:hypothetical protein